LLLPEDTWEPDFSCRRYYKLVCRFRADPARFLTLSRNAAAERLLKNSICDTVLKGRGHPQSAEKPWVWVAQRFKRCGKRHPINGGFSR
jgi:hypothetical protein